MTLKNLYNILNKNIISCKNLKKHNYLLKNYVDLDWKKYVKINDKTYNRQIYKKNDLFEIVIITWKNNQSTKIHGHPENGCLFKVLQGNIDEIIYTDEINYNNYKINDVNYIDNTIGKHQMINKDLISVSLHIYSPPFE